MAKNSNLDQFLRQGELKPLIEQALRIQQVNQALQPLLPEPFSGQIQVASVKSGTVLLDVPHASMLTLLRYQGSELLSRLRQEPGLSGLASIKFRITPVYPKKEEIAQPIEIKRISSDAAALLLQTAEKLEEGQLKTALLHFATKT